MRRPVVPSLLAALLFALAGCGDDKKESAAPATKQEKREAMARALAKALGGAIKRAATTQPADPDARLAAAYGEMVRSAIDADPDRAREAGRELLTEMLARRMAGPTTRPDDLGRLIALPPQANGNRVVVLVDTSASMAAPDGATPPDSHVSLLKRLADHPRFRSRVEAEDIRVYSVPLSDTQRSRLDLAQPLPEGTAGVIVLTDGQPATPPDRP